jgi:putative PIG3 family NAD(P)H quinone oxidoreductase
VHAVTVTGDGRLAWSVVPDPAPGPGEVLLDVVATAVNRADILQRQGRYPPPPGAPPYLGLECSGRIRALGADVTGWQVGDEVCALLAGGGYAEQVAVPVGQLMPVPAGVALAHSAALPEACATVWSNVFDLAALRPGEVLLVHGGSGGVGTFAIQLGRHHGAVVACTAGSPEKLARCRDLGAEIAVDHRAEDFVERVRAGTDGHGADVILDVVGAGYLARNLDLLAVGGRLAVIGLQGGARAELDLGLLLVKRALVLGSTLRARPLADKARIVAGVVRDVWPAVTAGAVRPVLHATVPIQQAAEAHRIVETGEHVGKVLLAVG